MTTEPLDFHRQGAGFVLRDTAGRPIATLILVEEPGATMLAMTVGENKAESRLNTADSAHLRDVTAQAHARACCSAAVEQGKVLAAEPRVPRRELPVQPPYRQAGPDATDEPRNTGIPETTSHWR